MKYPADIITSDGQWGRIHRGHNLDRDMLRQDLIDSNVDVPRYGSGDIEVREGNFRLAPRVKWCANYGGCDQEGEWHGHWYEVQPARPENAMTVATWGFA